MNEYMEEAKRITDKLFAMLSKQNKEILDLQIENRKLIAINMQKVSEIQEMQVLVNGMQEKIEELEAIKIDQRAKIETLESALRSVKGKV